MTIEFDDFDTQQQAEETQEYQDYIDMLELENNDPNYVEDFEADMLEVGLLMEAVADLENMWDDDNDDETDSYAGDRQVLPAVEK
tara:strand:+ start:950 stop:1204 length:255 start_codon:yes stop_codon:yes gene_type:complete